MTSPWTTGDWVGWVVILICTLVSAQQCYRMGRLVGAADGETLDVFYGGLMLACLLCGVITFIHAPFHAFLR